MSHTRLIDAMDAVEARANVVAAMLGLHVQSIEIRLKPATEEQKAPKANSGIWGTALTSSVAKELASRLVEEGMIVEYGSSTISGARLVFARNEVSVMDGVHFSFYEGIDVEARKAELRAKLAELEAME